MRKLVIYLILYKAPSSVNGLIENHLAICNKSLDGICCTDPKFQEEVELSVGEFLKFATDIKVYRYKTLVDPDYYRTIISNANSELEFYKFLTTKPVNSILDIIGDLDFELDNKLLV